MTLPTDNKARKEIPLARGCLDYFPDALAAVARLSQAGNDKHNPGQPLHWSREKSGDHADCIVRHLLERGKVDPEDGTLHDVKVAWRALALAQLAIEKQRDEVLRAAGCEAVYPPQRAPFTEEAELRYKAIQLKPGAIVEYDGTSSISEFLKKHRE